MSIISVSHNYHQSPSKVFAALDDFAGIQRFHPLLESSPLVEGTPETGVGAERVCHLYDGNTLHERVVGSEPNKWMSVEIVDTSMPLNKADGRFELKATEDGGTELTLTMDFEAKMGLLGKALDKLVMARKFKANLGLLLAALEQHLTTGADIPRDWQPAA